MTPPTAAAPSDRRSPQNAFLVAAAVVGFGFLGSRLLGVLRTVATADAFGTDPDLAAFNVAFRLPDLIFQVLAGATLGSAFIPVFARLYRREGEARAWQLASSILNLVTAGTAVLCLLAFIFAPLLVPLLAPDLGKDIGEHARLTEKAVSLTRFMLLSALLFSVSGMLSGIHNARQQFLGPALAPILYNVAIIFGAVVLSGPFGVEGLATGVVAGAALHLAIQVPGLRREKMAYRFIFGLRDPATREVARLMGPRVLGLAATQFNFLITIYFASKIGSSAINDLNYAWLVAQLPLALFGMALSTAVFPSLAEHAAEKDYEALRATTARVLRVIIFLTAPAAAGLALLSVPIVTILLQHGEFTAADTAITASAMSWYCLGLVPMAGIEIHSRAFYALGDTRTPVILAVGAVALNLVLSAMLYGSFAHEGLAFALSIAAWFEWLMLYKAYTVKTGASATIDLAAMSLVSICTAAMVLVLAVAFAPFDNVSWFDNLVLALAGAVAGGLIYLGAARLAGIPEVDLMLDRLLARLGVRYTVGGP